MGDDDASPPLSADASIEVERVILSTHSTLSVFRGTAIQPCRHRTTLCPDRCGHGGSVAAFAVQRYFSYAKPGLYGDERQTVFHARVDEAPPAIAATIASTPVGALVRLDYTHYYVTRKESSGGQCSFPERVITRLDPCAAGGAAAPPSLLLRP
jgi:hypothetical protein